LESHKSEEVEVKLDRKKHSVTVPPTNFDTCRTWRVPPLHHLTTPLEQRT